MILVTGASGLLGQWGIAALAAPDQEILALSRHPLDKPLIADLNWQGRVIPVAADIGAPAELSAALTPWRDRITSVVHLAGYIPNDTNANDVSSAEPLARINVLGTANLITALAGGKLCSFVYASSFEVYGAPQYVPLDEASSCKPLSLYGATKLAAETLAAIACASANWRFVSLRFPAIYGPGDTIPRAIGNFLKAAAHGGDIILQGDGTDLRDLVYVADAAEAVRLAVTGTGSGIYNIADGKGYSIREMAETAHALACGTETRIIRQPGKRPRLDFVLTNAKARLELNWQPRQRLRDGMQAQINWLRGSR